MYKISQVICLSSVLIVQPRRKISYHGLNLEEKLNSHELGLKEELSIMDSA